MPFIILLLQPSVKRQAHSSLNICTACPDYTSTIIPTLCAGLSGKRTEHSDMRYHAKAWKTRNEPHRLIKFSWRIDGTSKIRQEVKNFSQGERPY